MTNNQTYYYLGKRDAMADLCVSIRMHGLVGGVRRAVDLLQGVNPENPHVEPTLKILEKHERKDGTTTPKQKGR